MTVDKCELEIDFGRLEEIQDKEGKYESCYTSNGEEERVERVITGWGQDLDVHQSDNTHVYKLAISYIRSCSSSTAINIFHWIETNKKH